MLETKINILNSVSPAEFYHSHITLKLDPYWNFFFTYKHDIPSNF